MPKAPKQSLMIVDPDADFLEWASRHLRAPSIDIHTHTDAESALKAFADSPSDLVLIEIRLAPFNGMELLRRIRHQDPQAMIVITTGFPSTNHVIECMKLGAYDFLRKESLAYDLRPVVEGALKALEQTRATVAAGGNHSPDLEHYKDSIIGTSDTMQDVFKMIGRVSRSDVPVLITGESGSGKEIVANAIHRFSPRAKNEFVAINCAAIPANLLESELFGHEKGAFTGAMSQRIGRFEQCDGGTLFLDEIGDMPIEIQSKLLRVLQEGEFSRVGGNQNLSTNVRVLAATNKDLESQVAASHFREDLFYRLNVVRIHIPPLRDRQDDIVPLAEFFLQKLSNQKGGARLQLSEDTKHLLQGYTWPGNVRELENTIQRATVLATGNVLLTKDIPLGHVPQNRNAPYEKAEAPAEPSPPDPLSTDPKIKKALETLFEAAESSSELNANTFIERESTRHAMVRCDANPAKAAKLLGITAAALRKRLDKYKLATTTDAKREK
ncbi:MAG: sigma-54 dependent transcriptional regulator [Verrucomicrobiota bacterium]